MSKFSRLFALASKATGKAATLTRKVEGEGSVSLKFDTFPVKMTADGFETLASEKGGRVMVTAVVGEGVGKASGVLGTAAAAEMVREMTSDETEPARKPVPRNGKPEPATATA
jgi:hypothetical protein